MVAAGASVLVMSVKSRRRYFDTATTVSLLVTATISKINSD
jgi:hypothetical protein